MAAQTGWVESYLLVGIPVPKVPNIAGGNIVYSQERHYMFCFVRLGYGNVCKGSEVNESNPSLLLKSRAHM